MAVRSYTGASTSLRVGVKDIQYPERLPRECDMRMRVRCMPSLGLYSSSQEGENSVPRVFAPAPSLLGNV